MTSAAHRRIALVVIAFLTNGCSSSLDGPFFGSSPLPPDAAPVITAITPNLGSTVGSAPVTITGSGFKAGAIVTFGGTVVDARRDLRDPPGTKLYLDTPAHEAGAVDVIMTNPAGNPGTLAAGYTYALPQSFDFNGSWGGFGNAGQDIPILFTIKSNAVVSVSCDVHWTMTFASPVPVIDGAFSYSTDAGVIMSGRIVSTSDAVGSLNVAPCSSTSWVARKY